MKFTYHPDAVTNIFISPVYGCGCSHLELTRCHSLGPARSVTKEVSLPVHRPKQSRRVAGSSAKSNPQRASLILGQKRVVAPCRTTIVHRS